MMDNQYELRKKPKPLIFQFKNEKVAQFAKSMVDEEAKFNSILTTVATSGKLFCHTKGDRKKDDQLKSYISNLVAFTEA